MIGDQETIFWDQTGIAKKQTKKEDKDMHVIFFETTKISEKKEKWISLPCLWGKTHSL